MSSGLVLVVRRIEAMRLHAETQAAAGDMLDPNTQAHAEIAGWMMGHGCRTFKVHGDVAPYGLLLRRPADLATPARQTWLASPGDWIVLESGVFQPYTDDQFRGLFRQVGQS